MRVVLAIMVAKVLRVVTVMRAEMVVRVFRRGGGVEMQFGRIPFEQH